MSPHIINGPNGHSGTNRFHPVNRADDPIHKPAHDGFSTRAIHVGSEPSEETGAVIPAISLSTTYKQDEVGVHKGFEYTRSANPNCAALERMLAALEDNGTRGQRHARACVCIGQWRRRVCCRHSGPACTR